MRWPG